MTEINSAVKPIQMHSKNYHNTLHISSSST